MLELGGGAAWWAVGGIARRVLCTAQAVTHPCKSPLVCTSARDPAPLHRSNARGGLMGWGSLLCAHTRAPCRMCSTAAAQ